MAQANAPADTVPSEGYVGGFVVPHDRDTERPWILRWTVAAILILVTLFGPKLFFQHWGVKLINEWFAQILGLVGLLLSAEIIGKFVPARLMLFNKEWTGYVAQNIVTGDLEAYGPGLHITYPTEARNEDGNWSLQLITRDFSLKIPTATSEVTLQGEYGYANDLARLPHAIGMKDDASINDRLESLIEAFLTGENAAKAAADIVRDSTPALNGALARKFHRAEIDDPDTPMDERKLETISEKYGLKLVFVTVKNVSFPPAVQKARDAREEAAQMFEVVAQMYGYTTDDQKNELREKIRTGAISKTEYDKMLNRAMAASENATMAIQVIEGGGQGLVLTGNQSGNQGAQS